MDFASLLIKADSRQAKSATGDLKKLSSVAKTTDDIVGKLNHSFSPRYLLGGVAAGFTIHAIAAEFTKLTTAASDLNETTSKTGEIFQSNKNDIIDWSKTANTAIGQSQKQAQDAAGTFGIFGASAGLAGEELVDFSKRFTVLASDLASFYNTSPEDAIVAIGAAMRGENEPIRRYGVLLDDMTLRQEALRMGLVKTTKEALTPQQKVLAASEQIFRQTATAQGDFQRTSEGLANTERIKNAVLEDNRAILGEKLMPLMKEWYDLQIKISNHIVGPGVAAIRGANFWLQILTNTTLDSIRAQNLLADAQSDNSDEMKSKLLTIYSELENKLISLNEKIGELQSPQSISGKFLSGIGIAFNKNIERYQKQIDDIKAQMAAISNIISSDASDANSASEAAAAAAEAARKAAEARAKAAALAAKAEEDYLRIVTEAETARLNNIPNDIEKELALHEYKFTQLKEKYAASSKMIIEITKWETEEKKAIIKKYTDDYNTFLIGIREMEAEQKNQDITSRAANLLQLQETAETARLNNIPNQIERELALHQYKFDRLKEMYTEGSLERIAIVEQEEAEREAIIKRGNEMAFNAGQDFFGAMANLTRTFAGEQSEIYQTMFMVGKAFALAKAGLKLGEALAEAGASAAPPYNLIPIAIAGAEFATIIADIAAVQFAGMKDKGGFIPSGQWGIAGEYGPEIINGPATVTSRTDTASMLKPEVKVRIINSIDPSIMDDWAGSDMGEEKIMNVIRRNQIEIGAY